MLSKYTAAVIAISTALLFSTSACRNVERDIPFPEQETEFAQPTSKSFQFSKPDTLKWIVTDPDSIKPAEEKRLDLDSLPSKPFDIGEAVSLPKPMRETKFDWDSIPEFPFDIDKFPAKPFRFKTFMLDPPQIVKAGPLHPKQGASRGVMELGTDEGLPGSNSLSYLSDTAGTLWIGTYKGLCRYDGENIEIYGAAQGLSDERISSLAKDNNGCIWMGTLSGNIYVLDKKAGLLKQLPGIYEIGPIIKIISDKSGLIWIATFQNGLFVVDEKKAVIKQIGAAQGLANQNLVGVLEDHRGFVWIASNGGIEIIDQKNKTIRRIKQKNGLYSDFAWGLMEDNRHRIWIGEFDENFSNGCINILDFKKNVIQYLGSEQGLVANAAVGFLQGKDNNIWISTSDGTVYKFDEKNGVIQKINIDVRARNLLVNLLEDEKGQIWVGSLVLGTSVIRPKEGMPGNYNEADGLSSKRVWGLLEDTSGKIWIGTYNGINIYDPQKKILLFLNKEQGLTYENSTHFFESKDGRIWIGSSDGNGLDIVDPLKKSIKHIGKKQGISNGNVTGMLQDNEGLIWMTNGQGGVYVLNPEKKLFKKLYQAPESKKAGAFSIIQDRQGLVWVGYSRGGVDILDYKNNMTRHLSAAQGLLSDEITSLFEDSKGRIWIASKTGIDVADIKQGILTTFTTRQGLASNDVYTLNEKSGKIYVGTSKGLTVLTPTTQPGKKEEIKWSAISYGKSQGLHYLDFNENAALLTKKGQFWWGLEDEVLLVMDEPQTAATLQSVYIRGINLMDRPQYFQDRNFTINNLKETDTLWSTNADTFYIKQQLPPDSSYTIKNKITWDSINEPYNLPVNLKLPHTQNYLSFQFTAGSTSSAGETKYRYILEGIDKNWSELSNKPFSESYRDLPPGDYTFKVAGLSQGTWSKPAAFSFTILPPWWETWWFRVLSVIALIIVIYAIIKERSQKLKDENILLEKKVNERTHQLQQSIAELKSTQTQLIQSEKMASLGELTAGIAHEIQNPLNFVNNFSEVSNELIVEMNDELNKGDINEAKVIASDIQQNLQKINHHGKRADAIVKGMLQHSRQTSGTKEPTEINALCDEYLRLAYHGLRAKDNSFNATMKTGFDESIHSINIVPQDIGRVLLNLYNNAFYAVNEKKKQQVDNYEPTVSVTTKKLNDKVEISVSDNGNGIPQKVVDKIFQPFFTTKPTGQGTGLGLSLSYDIIKAHGGEIKVESKEGEGSEFIIVLPIKKQI